MTNLKNIYIFLGFLYIAISIASIITHRVKIENYRFIKPIPLLLLLSITIFTFTFKSNYNINLIIFTIALFMGLAGDTFLLSKKLFLFGLFSFLLCHVFYIIYFYFLITKINFRPIIFLIPIAILAAISIIKFSKTAVLKKYKFPLMLYIIIISTMVFFALNAAFENSESSKMFMTGAILFYISDGFLSIERFIRTDKNLDIIVLSTYYLAQLLITIGVFISINIF